MTRHDDDRLRSGTTHLRDPGAALVTRLQALSTGLDDEPDPRYRARARARLVAMAAVRPPPPAPRSLLSRLLDVRAGDRPPSRWRGRMTAGLAGAAVCAAGLAALVAVAAGAQPGDPLYGLKRGTEQTQLALAGDSRGRTLLELASTRLGELRSIGGDAELVRETLRSMDGQATEGAALLIARAVADRDADSLRELATWSQQQAAELETLEPGLAATAEHAYSASAGLLDAIATRTTGLALVLDCPSGPATVGTDALGPVPGLCLGEPAPPAPEGPGPGEDRALPGSTLPPEAAAEPSGPTTSGASPGATDPAAPGRAGVPTPGVPPPPAHGPLRPTGPVPSVPGTTGTDRVPSPPVAVPGQVDICLPPLATVGNC